MSQPIQREVPLMESNGKNIVLFYPHIPEKAGQMVQETLRTRWIGQGPKVEEFEQRFSQKFDRGLPAIAVGSGTDALHLAYLLAGVKEGDEVVAPLFTCTATNIPFLYERAKIRFADIQPNTLNIDVNHVRKLVNEKTKAIVCVHYAGLPCDMKELREIADKWNIPIVSDSAHAVGAEYMGKPISDYAEYTMYSFQAIKHITTGDGGMLVMQDRAILEKSKRLRWFGIDRTAKQKGIWENDIVDVGYKYQMTDISACMGLAALDEIDQTLALRKRLFAAYEKGLKGIPGIQLIGAGYTDRTHAAWLCTIIAEKRVELQKKLFENGIESNQVHYRNDRYSIFGGRKPGQYPNMDAVEDKYLVLPLHTKMNEEHVQYICDIIRSGY